MFVFAILDFGIITDAGTLEPVINAILRVVAGSALVKDRFLLPDDAARRRRAR